MDEKEQIHEKPLLWSRSEVAVQLGISGRKVDELIQQGTLPSMSIGRRILVPRQAVLDWVEAQTRYNSRCAGLAVRNPKGERKCLNSARKGKGSREDPGQSSGGPLTQMQVVEEFNALLGQPTRGKR